jgi:hypothetical protein
MLDLLSESDAAGKARDERDEFTTIPYQILRLPKKQFNRTRSLGARSRARRVAISFAAA